MRRASKLVTFELPDTKTTHVDCRVCGQPRGLSEYRFFPPDHSLRMDFCELCERREGTLTLYRRFGAYATKQIVDMVYMVARIPEAKRTLDQARLLITPEVQTEPKSVEDAVQREIARRELARRRLLYFVTSITPAYSPGWVHQDIARRLERFMQQVDRGESPRLMLAVPPRHGKSALASINFPAWVLGHHPEWPIILSSYAQELPISFSRAIRDMMKDPEYQAVFPRTKIRPDARGVEEWLTTEGGGIKAAGVGVGLTGFGGRILLADDLIKDAEAAASDVIRNNTFEWYQTVFRTRLAPGGGILMIGTRWHWHDPAGRLLEIEEQLVKAGVPDYEREGWEVISYPAVAEHDEFLMRDGTIAFDANPDDAIRLLRNKGEALHPERYPLAELVKIKHNLTASNWSALYQQSPTPAEGDFFKRDDFIYRWLPPEWRPLCRVFLTVDYAISKKQRRDFTVVGAFALDSDDNLYVLELRRGRWGTQQIVDNVLAMCEVHKPEVYAGERGQIHEAVWPLIDEALQKKRIFISVDESLVPLQDKEVRARPLQGRMQRKKLVFSFDGATKPDVYDQTERELLQFPEGVNDDIVDCLAWGARLAQNLSLPSKGHAAKAKSWKDRLQATTAGTSHMAA